MKISTNRSTSNDGKRSETERLLSRRVWRAKARLRSARAQTLAPLLQAYSANVEGAHARRHTALARANVM